MKNEHKIDELFRQKLQQHSVAPTPAAWDKVAAGLNHKRRKRGGYYAAAAVLALLLSTSWFLFQQSETGTGRQQPNELAVTEAPVKEQAESVVPEPGKDATAAQAGSIAATKPDSQEAAAEKAAAGTLQAEAAKNAGTVTAVAASKKPIAPAAAPSATETANATPIIADVASKTLEIHKAMPAEQEASTDIELAIAQTEKQPATLERVPATTSMAEAPAVLASVEQVVIRYNPAAPAPEAEDAAKDDKGTGRVLSLLQKVKQGDVGLADIRHAKDNLLSGRFNKP